MPSSYGRSAVIGAALILGGTIAVAADLGTGNVSPIYGVSLPAGYREWPVVSAAHEAGSLNDIRVILGNEIAMNSLRRGQRPLPDGARLVRVAWKLVPSERNNSVFGQAQSFVAGEPTNVQVMVKDSGKYAATGGWGYGQFENGKVNPNVALMGTCNGCHQKLPTSEDFVFTHYAP